MYWKFQLLYRPAHANLCLIRLTTTHTDVLTALVLQDVRDMVFAVYQVDFLGTRAWGFTAHFFSNHRIDQAGKQVCYEAPGYCPKESQHSKVLGPTTAGNVAHSLHPLQTMHTSQGPKIFTT